MVTRVHIHTSVFIDDENISVFVDNIFLTEYSYPSLFYDSFGWSGKRGKLIISEKYFHFLSRLEFVFVVLSFSVDFYFIFTIQFIDERCRSSRKEFFEESIQTSVGVIFLDTKKFHY